MNTFDTLLFRRSVRKYEKGFKISTEELNRILETAMYAPSAMNKQPWEFIVIDDDELIASAQNSHPYCAFFGDAGTGIVVCVDLTKEYNGMGIIDVSLASQNIMLAAHALGYGTCYCGIYPEHSETFQELLDLPEHIEPIGLITIGKPAQPLATAKPDKSRFNPKTIHMNKW